MNKAKDFPGLTTAALMLAVLGHFIATERGWLPALPAALVKNPEAWSLYIGAAGVVAVLAGFAGVIIVFALTPGVPALVKMRADGGNQLRSNWISLVSNPMAAALLFMLAATLALSSNETLAGWIFELAGSLTILGALRMIWLFRMLAKKNIDSPESPTSATSAQELVQEAQNGYSSETE